MVVGTLAGLKHNVTGRVVEQRSDVVERLLLLDGGWIRHPRHLVTACGATMPIWRFYRADLLVTDSHDIARFRFTATAWLFQLRVRQGTRLIFVVLDFARLVKARQIFARAVFLDVLRLFPVVDAAQANTRGEKTHGDLRRIGGWLESGHVGRHRGSGHRDMAGPVGRYLDNCVRWVEGLSLFAGFDGGHWGRGWGLRN